MQLIMTATAYRQDKRKKILKDATETMHEFNVECGGDVVSFKK